MKGNSFWKYLKDYFQIYLPKQRNSSPKTIQASRDTWNLLLRYVTGTCGSDGNNIQISSFTNEMISGFLDHMDQTKHWKPSTHNQRLSCIRAFFKYASNREPLAYTTYADLLTIPLKKGTDTSQIIEYMPKDAVTSILSVIDKASLRGYRDYYFISLMYDTAARDMEMLQLCLGDVRTDNSTVYLMGKGNKPRIVPISKTSLRIHSAYVERCHKYSNDNAPLFYTKHGGEKTTMSDDNVARFLKKYAAKARESNPDVPENVHPHMIRHSRAMHLYQGGMPLSVLSEFLGHENPETTLIYARADTEMKRSAIAKASSLTNMGNTDHEPVWKEADIIGRLVRGY